MISDKIAIIRRSESSSQHIVECLHQIHHDVVDVCRRDALQIDEINDQGTVRCWLRDTPLQEFRAVIYLGTPCIYQSPYSPTRDEIYVQQELSQSLLAALWFNKSTRIINRTAVFSWNRLLFEPSHQVRLLAEFGWRTPLSVWHYDLLNDERRQVRYPAPEDNQKYYVLLSQNGYVMFPMVMPSDNVNTPASTLITRTQDYMRQQGLDWCVIPIIIEKGEVYAYGFQADIPSDIPQSLLRSILRSGLGMKL